MNETTSQQLQPFLSFLLEVDQVFTVAPSRVLVRHSHDSIQAGTSYLSSVNSRVQRQLPAVETHTTDQMLIGLYTFQTCIFGDLLGYLWNLIDYKECKEKKVDSNGTIPVQ